MAIGNLQTEADLKRQLEQWLDVLRPILHFPWKNRKKGVGEAEWPGGSPTTNAATITHGLGKTPDNVQITPRSNACIPSAPERSKTTFTVRIYNAAGSPGGGSKVTFDWEAEC